MKTFSNFGDFLLSVSGALGRDGGGTVGLLAVATFDDLNIYSKL